MDLFSNKRSHLFPNLIDLQLKGFTKEEMTKLLDVITINTTLVKKLKRLTTDCDRSPAALTRLSSLSSLTISLHNTPQVAELVTILKQMSSLTSLCIYNEPSRDVRQCIILLMELLTLSASLSPIKELIIDERYRSIPQSKSPLLRVHYRTG
jgi:hypothetical protein